MTKKKDQSTLLKKMETSLTSLIAEMDKKGNETKYSLTDRMKVCDRVLKLEGLKAKIEDVGYGTGFHSDDEEDD